MSGLMPQDVFCGFGATVAHAPGYAPVCAQVRAKQATVLRGHVRESSPKLPGVYGMLDRHGALIYVGKAKCLRTRLLSYFRTKSRDPKAGQILSHARSIVWETSPHEFTALVRELELIRRFRPRFNVRGIPDSRRYGYLCIGRPPAPYVYFTRELTGKETAAYGPLTGSERMREAARRLNDSFALRDCSQKQTLVFADQPELFPQERSPGCLRLEIGNCLGPCVGACTRRAYHAKVRAVKQFLDGTDLSTLDDLERNMQAAASAMRFEQALALRDRWQGLVQVSERLAWLRHARQEHTFVYPLVGHDGKDYWHIVTRGRIVATHDAPTARCQKLRKAIAGMFREASVPGDIGRGMVDSVLLVAGWFRKYEHERIRRIMPAELIAESC